MGGDAAGDGAEYETRCTDASSTTAMFFTQML